jgi:hypothetical protein
MRAVLLCPSCRSIFFDDAETPAGTVRTHLLFRIESVRDEPSTHSIGTDRNFDTKPGIFGVLESCGLMWQKLESSFEKYELCP